MEGGGTDMTTTDNVTQCWSRTDGLTRCHRIAMELQVLMQELDETLRTHLRLNGPHEFCEDFGHSDLEEMIDRLSTILREEP